ncbi:MAG: hypothetical protein V3V49_00600 [Candidatus Krumholzibacteria bacterium]
MRRAAVLALILPAFCVALCKADILILTDGTTYRGELDNQTTLHLNPLSLKKITILLERGGSRESKLVTFDARDVRRIILEVFEGREIIDLAGLRERQLEMQKQAAAAREKGKNAEQLAEPPEKPQVISLEFPQDDPSSHGDDAAMAGVDPSARDINSGLLLVGSGFVALGVGAVVGFGDEKNSPDGSESGRELGATNYVLIAAGAGVMAYGFLRVFRGRKETRPPAVQLGLGTGGMVLVGSRWRF